jgi:hypothetical protein
LQSYIGEVSDPEGEIISVTGHRSQGRRNTGRVTWTRICKTLAPSLLTSRAIAGKFGMDLRINCMYNCDKIAVFFNEVLY